MERQGEAMKGWERQTDGTFVAVPHFDMAKEIEAYKQEQERKRVEIQKQRELEKLKEIERKRSMELAKEKPGIGLAK